MVWVTQYRVTLVRSSDLVKADSMSPPQSLHARHFSTIQANRPTGESLRANPRVWGRVPWMAMYPPSSADQARWASSHWRSSSVISLPEPGMPVAKFRWMPAMAGPWWRPSAAHTNAPRSPPWAPNRVWPRTSVIKVRTTPAHWSAPKPGCQHGGREPVAGRDGTITSKASSGITAVPGRIGQERCHAGHLHERAGPPMQ